MALFGVNLWGLVDAAFYPFVLSPAIAALSMSGSSAVVAINALLLKRTKLAGIHQPGQGAALGSPPVAAIPDAHTVPAAATGNT